MYSLRFDNSFVRELPGDMSGDLQVRHTPNICWTYTPPTLEGTPELLAYSKEAAKLLDINEADITSTAFVQAFSGQKLLAGMMPFATRYGGHQFGQWAGQLGDGRAISLGELINSQGQRWELQLKGAGQTPYSRRADGRAVLRSSIREFLCSEAMFHLGVPTTRALSLISTGEAVTRDMLYNGNPRHELGAVVCRVAPSFIRFGHFEIFAAQGEHELLQRLVDFVIQRDFPQLQGSANERFASWFHTICVSTAQLMSEWMRVGFVHGVMNTDNMSILGLTIDYGPYGWLEEFEPGWTPNTTDAQTLRYCFGNQPHIARWNLERLADALSPITPSPQCLLEGLQAYDETLAESMQNMLCNKFGLHTWQPQDDELIGDIFSLMQDVEIDMTNFFQQLAHIDIQQPNAQTLQTACYKQPLFDAHQSQLQAWLTRYTQRIQSLEHTQRLEIMRQSNPCFVLRNYLALQAIEHAERDDVNKLYQLLDAARRPYQQDHPRELTALRPEWARHKPGASMLSCSS